VSLCYTLPTSINEAIDIHDLDNSDDLVYERLFCGRKDKHQRSLIKEWGSGSDKGLLATSLEDQRPDGVKFRCWRLSDDPTPVGSRTRLSECPESGIAALSAKDLASKSSCP